MGGRALPEPDVRHRTTGWRTAPRWRRPRGGWRHRAAATGYSCLAVKCGSAPGNGSRGSHSSWQRALRKHQHMGDVWLQLFKRTRTSERTCAPKSFWPLRNVLQ